ncbi:predicted protein [Arabidopsis lyrata subsp. lyrata]|uniref:Predicted protein n=1 Tax=Arabidopsis lyrata subsp. lyrata TaxID=81972 RepID=D7LIT8_ARALL|nr:predicted protein [Arabidopsis lyrata subsp. lyrata]
MRMTKEREAINHSEQHQGEDTSANLKDYHNIQSKQSLCLVRKRTQQATETNDQRRGDKGRKGEPRLGSTILKPTAHQQQRDRNGKHKKGYNNTEQVTCMWMQ